MKASDIDPCIGQGRGKHHDPAMNREILKALAVTLGPSLVIVGLLAVLAAIGRAAGWW